MAHKHGMMMIDKVIGMLKEHRAMIADEDYYKEEEEGSHKSNHRMSNSQKEDLHRGYRKR